MWVTYSSYTLCDGCVQNKASLGVVIGYDNFDQPLLGFSPLDDQCVAYDTRSRRDSTFAASQLILSHHPFYNLDAALVFRTHTKLLSISNSIFLDQATFILVAGILDQPWKCNQKLF